jgi:hypothetical protein
MNARAEAPTDAARIGDWDANRVERQSIINISATPPKLNL